MFVRVRTRFRENDVLHAEEVKQVSGVISFGTYEGGGEGAEGRVMGDRGTGKEGGEMERRREETVGGEGGCMEMHVFEIKQDL